MWQEWARQETLFKTVTPVVPRMGSAAQRREELEAVPRRLTNGNICRLNYPLKEKKKRERTLGLSLLSLLIKFKGPQVGIPQRL